MPLEAGLKNLMKAIEFEKEGFDFFVRSAGEAADPAAKSVFLFLAEEERRHADYLLGLHARLSADGRWPSEITISPDRDFEPIFAEASAATDDEALLSATEEEALRLASALENRGCRMYSELREKAATEPEKALYRILAEWEAAHARLVDGLLARIEAEDPDREG